MVDQELLDILVCPENKTPVKLVSGDVLGKMNAAIEQKTLKNRGGDVIEESVDGALLREDGTLAYPIRDDIPIMLIDEAVPMDQVD